ncbi:MAG: hypothetical protein M3Z97_14835 [Candidatus Dormibacteraeota bacterium]|nr:hypothetical protein [Candidatus Dormibacteraeota bacterium]
MLAGCLAVQYLGYSRLLLPGLRSPESGEKRRALKRWLLFVAAWQAVLVAGLVGYALLLPPTRRIGPAWVVPPLAALLGTALPLQLAVVRIARSALR